VIEAIRRLYEEHGARFLELPNRSLYPLDDFADTFYHMNEEAAVRHTEMLAERLRPLLSRDRAPEAGKPTP
jgi:hypothetical protein